MTLHEPPLIPAKAGIQRWVAAFAGTSGLTIAVVLSALAGIASARAAERVVNFYNWSDYIAPSVLEDFTKQTGIKVRYDTFNSNDTLEAKLLAGNSGYDVVVPTAYFLARQIEAGIFLKLDKAKLPNLVNAWPEITDRLARYDPGNRYAVNYMWGTTGIGYNVKAARQILGANVPSGELLDSWNDVFDPARMAKFADCGIHMLNSSDDIMSAALHDLKLDPNSSDPADLQKAADLLDQDSALMSASFTPRNISTGWRPGKSVWRSASRAISSRRKSAPPRPKAAWRSVIRSRKRVRNCGSMFFAIPRDAPDPDEAHALINYLLKPEVAATNTNFISYANGNLASQKLIDKSILDDPDNLSRRGRHGQALYHFRRTTRERSA